MTQEPDRSGTQEKEKQNVDADYQPEQGSPEDVQGDAALRSSSPLNDRVNKKSEEALEEA